MEGATASDGFFERGVAAAHGLVAHNGRWYVPAYDHLREDLRVGPVLQHVPYRPLLIGNGVLQGQRPVGGERLRLGDVLLSAGVVSETELARILGQAP